MVATVVAQSRPDIEQLYLGFRINDHHVFCHVWAGFACQVEN